MSNAYIKESKVTSFHIGMEKKEITTELDHQSLYFPLSKQAYRSYDAIAFLPDTNSSEH